MGIASARSRGGAGAQAQAQAPARAQARTPSRATALLLSLAVLAHLPPSLSPPLGAEEAPPCGVAPPAKPKRIKGGEGVPPLPLPATPLRRSERKRDPAPPVLIGKLRWGRQDLVWRFPDGSEARYADWSHDPNDVHRLLEALAREIHTRYRPRELDLAGFSFDPAEVPILYASGLAPFRLSDAERDALREYLLRGGTFLAVAHHGSRDFSDSIRAEAARLFPGRPFGLLPPDHPIHRAHRKIERVSYTPGTKDRPDGAPWLEGLILGCRAAVILSPYDLCCTWDSDHLPGSMPGVLGQDAFTLGVNILSYAIAYYPLGKLYGRWGRVEVEDESVDRGDFVFAQVRHRGDHDPHPAAFASLLGEAMKATSLGARLRRELIPLDGPDLGAHPFLYMTGHGDFRLSEAERSGLRRHLASGGFLLADSCCGDLGFDVAFRREVSLALDGRELAVVPAEHAVFGSFEKISRVEYTTAVRASFPGLEEPLLEGIEIDGRLSVVYSRFDIGNGWEGEERPFSLAVRSADARRLGVNIIVFCMTH